MTSIKLVSTNISEEYGAIKAISDFLDKYFEQNNYDEIIVLGIGTDKCIGDSLGPLVGTILRKKDFHYPVYGTLKKPVHALNIRDRLKTIDLKHPNAFIIAVDACLADNDSIGDIHIRKGPINPGKGVGKKLPSVGHLSIIGIVDKLNNESSLSLHSIRLSFVFEMAEIIAEGIVNGIKN